MKHLPFPLWWVLGGRWDSFTSPFATRWHGSTRGLWKPCSYLLESLLQGNSSPHPNVKAFYPLPGGDPRPIHLLEHSVQWGVGIHQVKLCPKCLVRVSHKSLMSISTPACKTSLRGGSIRGMRRQVRMTRIDQGRSVSTAVSVGVKVAYFCQVRSFRWQSWKRIKIPTETWGRERKKSKGRKKGSEGTGE